MLTPTGNLYYGLGEVAYAIAMADGRIQKDEIKKFHKIIESELAVPQGTLSVADIIFHIMNKDQVSAETSYENGMKQIRLNSHYLSPELKLSFLHVVEKVGNAFPPVLVSEKNMIARFRNDIAGIHGDPVFYAAKK